MCICLAGSIQLVLDYDYLHFIYFSVLQVSKQFLILFNIQFSQSTSQIKRKKVTKRGVVAVPDERRKIHLIKDKLCKTRNLFLAEINSSSTLPITDN